MNPPRIEVWALPKGGWLVVVVRGAHVMWRSARILPTPRAVKRELEVAAVLRRALGNPGKVVAHA